jgi:hypothetical protein
LGPSVVMCFWSMILTPIGLLLGAIIGFGVVPFIQRIRGNKTIKPKPIALFSLGGCITVTTCLLFVPTMVFLGAYIMEKDLGDYWKSSGAWDWWRMPLEYPYELIAVGTQDIGYIREWETNTQYVDGIARFYKNGNLIAGEASSYQGKLFIFDCSNGTVIWYDNEAEFREAMVNFGFDRETVFLTVEENMKLYWKEH